MFSHTIKDKYYSLFKEYLERQDEASLSAVADFGVALPGKETSLEEIIELHQQAIEHFGEEFPDVKLRETADQLSAPLLELINTYQSEFRAAGDEFKPAAETGHSKDILQNSVLEAISDILFLLDPDGTIRDYYAQSTDDLFVQPDDFLNKRMQDVLPETAALRFAERLNTLQVKGQAMSYEYSLQVPKGLRHYEGRLSFSSNSRQIILTTQDVTERKLTEELYQIYFAKNILSVYWIEFKHPIDIQLPVAEQIALLSSEGYVKDVSEYCAKAYGLSRNDLIGQPVTNILGSTNSDSSNDLKEFQQEFVRGGYVNSREVGPIAAANGKNMWFINSMQGVVENGYLIRYWGSQIDITERKQAEAEHQRLLLAVEQAAESFMITDAKGTIEYINPAFERITGYSRQEAIGQNARILKSGKHDKDFYRAMWETLSAGNSWTRRFINKKKDGNFYTGDQVISPVRDAAGKIVNYVSVQRDVTQELQLEKQFQQAQKMESVGHLAGGVAHDFNNMLGVILGYAELAKQQIQADSPLFPLLDEIQKAAQRSAEITRQLLAFARKQTVAPQSLNLNDKVPGVLNMLHRLIGEDIDLSWRPGVELWMVLIDPNQVDQLLANLCINARDAIDGVGEIIIQTSNVILDETYCATRAGLSPGHYVELTVSDDGEGMTAETLNNIFEPFFTTKEAGSGTGLGLATVYGIIKQNDGFIFAASEPGKGAIFTIYLPKNVLQLKPDSPSGKVVTPEGQGETILLVEDEAALLDLSRNMLERLGYRVLAANTPGEALILFERNTIDVGLLLTDVVMPEMDGKALAEKLQSREANLKVLYMSGYPADVVARRGVLDKDVHFIQKPFRKQHLAIKVREVFSDTTD